MKLTLRQQLTQFAHLMQSALFPVLEEQVGELSESAKRLVATLELIPLTRFIPASRGWLGRPSKDRDAIARAFVAKAVYGFSHTRQLLEALQRDAQLRQICGWKTTRQVPHESTFSRAFAEFAQMELPQFVHEALIRETHQDRLVGHIARDSTAIEARERFPKTAAQKAPSAPAPSPPALFSAPLPTVPSAAAPEPAPAPAPFSSAPFPAPPPVVPPAAAPEPAPAPRKRGAPRGRRGPQKRWKGGKPPAPLPEGTRLHQQRSMSLPEMLQDLPKHCDIGCKKDSQGNPHYWRGFKLHLDVADGQIPISAVLTSASVHDSQVAIPLMTLSSQRVAYCYDLMDSAYDARHITEQSRTLGHISIVDPPQRGGGSKSTLLPNTQRQFSWAEAERYKARTMIERINGRLKDEFGGRHIYVRGARKVFAHLMFGVLALTADQLLRLTT